MAYTMSHRSQTISRGTYPSIYISLHDHALMEQHGSLQSIKWTFGFMCDKFIHTNRFQYIFNMYVGHFVLEIMAIIYVQFFLYKTSMTFNIMCT